MREERKFVGTVRVVEVLENVFQYLVVDTQIRSKPIKAALRALFFLSKVKESRIIAVIGLAEKLKQALIDPGAILQGHKPAIRHNATIFADTQENDPVYGALDGKVEFPMGQVRIP